MMSPAQFTSEEAPPGLTLAPLERGMYQLCPFPKERGPYLLLCRHDPEESALSGPSLSPVSTDSVSSADTAFAAPTIKAKASY